MRCGVSGVWRGAILLGVLAAGCKRENQITRHIEGSIAVTAGDFDNVAEPLNRMIVDHASYEGLIAFNTWDDTYEPDNVALKVETLFGEHDELTAHGLIFVASGTRGFGDHVYNGVDADDQFVSDELVIEELQAFVARGGVLVVTDWAYDLIAAAWPDAVQFLGQDEGDWDAAQVGESDTVTATIEDELLATALDMDSVAIELNMTNWAVIESVGEDTTVWLTADVAYRRTDGTGTQTLDATPLLVEFSPNGFNGGRVIFASFHIDAQTDAVVDEMLRVVVGDFDEKADDPVVPIE